MSNRKFTVYALTCKGEIRYIGITSQSLARRLYQHLSDAKRPNRKEHKTNWLRKCLADGSKVEIKPLRKWMDEKDAFRIEKQIIAKLRPRLVNVHAGGTSGYSGLPEEAKQRHRISMKVASKDRDYSSLNALANSARERKRLAAHAGEPPGTEWRGRLETTVTLHDRVTGRMQTFDIYRGQLRDRYDIRRDGLPWRHGVTATWFAAALRKRLAVHVAPVWTTLSPAAASMRVPVTRAKAVCRGTDL